ncbi:MAG: AAA family ATPase, partial [Faecalibacillus sp.]
MEELKYRIKNNKSLMKRNKTNEYLREMLKNHHCLFLQGIDGSGKTYAMYSLIDDYYKDRYIYLHLDQRDNQLEVFQKSIEKAFFYASLDIDHIQIDRPHLFVLDQFENINHEKILDYIKYFITYMPSSLYLLIVSRQPLPSSLYNLIQYHHLTVIEKCPLFFDKNETVKLSKQLHVKNQDPYLLWKQSHGWPLVVSYIFLHDYVINEDDYILDDFFRKMTLSSSMLELIKLIGLAPYMTFSLLKTLHIEHLIEDLSFLCQISLVIKEEEQLSLIPIYQKYVMKEYQKDYQYVLQKVYPYYKEHHYIFDVLIYDYYLDKEALFKHIQMNDFSICLKGNPLQIEKIIHLLPVSDHISLTYIKGYYAYLHALTKQYQEMVELLEKQSDHLDAMIRMINLMYLSPDYDLKMILEKKNKDIPLYNLLTRQASYLNGQRDLSRLIYLKHKDKKEYDDVISLFHDLEKRKLELAEIEYLFYIDQPHLCLEQLDHFLSEDKELSSDMIMVLATLYFKIYYVLGLKESAKNFYEIYRNKIRNNRNDHEMNLYMDLYDIYCACLFNDHEKAYDWYRLTKLDDKVSHHNCFQYYLIARIHYMMKRYDQAY